MATIQIDHPMYEALIGHLLGRDDDLEEAAFLLAHVDGAGHDTKLVADELVLVPPEEYAYQGPFFLELTDEFRGDLIRRAWRANAALVEFHSHPGQTSEAAFSPSDLAGLREFVPHIWWRLDQRPYAGVVVAQGSFDALVWESGPAEARMLDAMLVGGRRLRPTGRSQIHWDIDREAI